MAEQVKREITPEINALLETIKVDEEAQNHYFCWALEAAAQQGGAEFCSDNMEISGRSRPWTPVQTMSGVDLDFCLNINDAA